MRRWLESWRARSRDLRPRSRPSLPAGRGRARRVSAPLGLEEPGLNRVIREAYALLGLLTFFTAGPKEARAWTVASGRYRAPGGRRHPHRFREGLHLRRGHRLRRLRCLQRREGRQGDGRCGWKVATTSSAKAMSATSASTFSQPNPGPPWRIEHEMGRRTYTQRIEATPAARHSTPAQRANVSGRSGTPNSPKWSITSDIASWPAMNRAIVMAAPRRGVAISATNTTNAP